MKCCALNCNNLRMSDEAFCTVHKANIQIHPAFKSEGEIKNLTKTVTTTINPEYSGGSVNYYSVLIKSPTTPDTPPYVAECNDIIEALNMNFAEGNAFKAIWRKCAARLGKLKEGYKDGLYDAEKVEFFGKRMVVQEKQTKK